MGDYRVMEAERLLQLALAKLKRQIEYADVRMTRTESQYLDASAGSPGSVDSGFDTGFGVRVLKNGSWGYAASMICSENEVKRVVSQAIDIAESGKLLRGETFRLSPLQPAVAEFRTPIRIDPFTVPWPERMEFLVSASSLAAKVPGVRTASAEMSCTRMETWFSSTEGCRLYQRIILTGATLSVSAGDRHEMQTRSFPSSQGGSLGTGGYERVMEAGIPENAQKTAEEAVMLLKAPPCPAGSFTVIFSPDQLGLQIHETIGHPLELDRVYGAEANFSGTSFATPEKLGNFRYAADCVNVVTDPTIPGALGSYGFDDDGVPARRIELIRDGILKGYLSGRETAGRLGVISSGNNRAAGWRYMPINRMSNTILLPGRWTLEQMLSDTGEGLFMQTNRSWSIDDRRENFRFECEIAHEIKGGCLGQVYKNPSFTGRTVPFWNACDAICDQDHFQIWGTPSCGKGEPSQSLHTSQGAAHSRFRNVAVEPAGKRRS